MLTASLTLAPASASPSPAGTKAVPAAAGSRASLVSYRAPSAPTPAPRRCAPLKPANRRNLSTSLTTSTELLPAERAPPLFLFGRSARRRGQATQPRAGSRNRVLCRPPAPDLVMPLQRHPTG